MTHGPRERLLSATLVLVVLSAACVTTATIKRDDGPPLRGTIVGGSKRSILIRDASGSGQRVLRANITEIEHPGTNAVLVGVAVLVVGLARIIFGVSQCGSNSVLYCASVFVPAPVGLGMIAWGSSVSSASQRAARNRSRDDDDPDEAPERPIPPPAPPEATAVVPPAATTTAPDAGSAD
jgi:hypothetical protein